jgi:CRP/FNR family transcriptional regulator
VLLEGEVKVFKLSPEGREKILHLFRPPQPIGEAAVFSGQRFPAHAQANGPSRLLFFPRDAFIRLGASDPTILLNMLGILSARLRGFTDQIESLTLKEVPARLASYLIHLSEEQKNPDGAVLRLSRGQLASILGTIPETLSRALSRLAAQGLIAVDGRRIDILDREGLRQAAGGQGRADG